MNKLSDRTRIILSVVLCLVLVSPILIKVGTSHIKQAIRQRELSDMYAYKIYFSYAAVRERYEGYIMCNPEYTMEEIQEQIFTEETFASLKKHIDEGGFPVNPTRLYLVAPSDEIPYGWEKSELHISTNFDQAILRQQSLYMIDVPYGAKSLKKCSVWHRGDDNRFHKIK